MTHFMIDKSNLHEEYVVIDLFFIEHLYFCIICTGISITVNDQYVCHHIYGDNKELIELNWIEIYLNF
jgi:hypothetical protein